jgi:hypothetical protein
MTSHALIKTAFAEDTKRRRKPLFSKQLLLLGLSLGDSSRQFVVCCVHDELVH